MMIFLYCNLCDFNSKLHCFFKTWKLVFLHYHVPAFKRPVFKFLQSLLYPRKWHAHPIIMILALNNFSQSLYMRYIIYRHAELDPKRERAEALRFCFTLL